MYEIIIYWTGYLPFSITLLTLKSGAPHLDSNLLDWVFTIAVMLRTFD